jgi:hypothetical protein
MKTGASLVQQPTERARFLLSCGAPRPSPPGRRRGPGLGRGEGPFPAFKRAALGAEQAGRGCRAAVGCRVPNTGEVEEEEQEEEQEEEAEAEEEERGEGAVVCCCLLLLRPN